MMIRKEERKDRREESESSPSFWFRESVSVYQKEEDGVVDEEACIHHEL